ncbi:beta-galactosidase-like [Dermacentor albipictus]|uniref:beta-galactosidase-like n=1 Tax=Dermacentor albipictus TaxID=60249 RepID=UPI0031FDE5E4
MRACVLAAVLVSWYEILSGAGKRSFAIDYTNHTFLKDGKPFRFVGGSMHYFRVPRAYWDGRLHTLRMGGPNAIDFYIDWSGHEPEPGQYNFIDNYDVLAFLEAIKKADLLAILRPGPFICGEVDNAGFPYWLLRKYPNMQYRTMEKEYVEEVTKWFDKLLPMLVPYLYKNGGPIIMVQVENEYGHLKGFCDPNYMEFMLSLQEKHLGKDVVMFRTDSPSLRQYECDKVRDILVAGNCDPKADVPKSFDIIRRAQVKPGGPVVVGEYYTGWMNYWGWNNNPAYPPAVINTFEKMMDDGANVIFYMFHGGTNFGFKAATSAESPLVTSYDYDAPIGEDGDPKAYYFTLRKSIGKYIPLKAGELPKGSPKMGIDAILMPHSMSLKDVMDHFRNKGWLKRKKSKFPLTFEELGQDFGFLMYHTQIAANLDGEYLMTLHGLRDMAQLYVRQERHLMRIFDTAHLIIKPNTTVRLKKGEKLTILVENMGREDFGPKNRDPKGMTNVTVNDVTLTDWTIEAVPVTQNRDISELISLMQQPRNGDGKTPHFYYGWFTLGKGVKPLDTFLDPSNYTKGVAFINGINLGRYWPAVGPQIRLYVPGVYLKPYPEENKVILFELEGIRGEQGGRGVSFSDRPFLTAETGSPHP